MKIALTEGETYGYKLLMQSLEGGSEQFYLPFRDQTIYAALLTPAKNPDAPEVILVGKSPRVAAAGVIFSRQETPVPVFVKQSTNQWRYKGMYRVAEVLGQIQATKLAKKADREDVAFALRLEKIIVGSSSSSEYWESLLPYREGECGQVTRNAYERDPAARAACLRHHGMQCCVCGFDFKEEYGKRGEGFIHVHHLIPLSERGGPTPTDPIADLVPVCPNCHSMLHARNELISPEELRGIFWSQSGRKSRCSRLKAPDVQ